MNTEEIKDFITQNTEIFKDKKAQYEWIVSDEGLMAFIAYKKKLDIKLIHKTRRRTDKIPITNGISAFPSLYEYLSKEYAEYFTPESSYTLRYITAFCH
jgi:hypothetical protein